MFIAWNGPTQPGNERCENWYTERARSLVAPNLSSGNRVAFPSCLFFAQRGSPKPVCLACRGKSSMLAARRYMKHNLVDLKSVCEAWPCASIQKIGTLVSSFLFFSLPAVWVFYTAAMHRSLKAPRVQTRSLHSAVKSYKQMKHDGLRSLHGRFPKIFTHLLRKQSLLRACFA